MRKCTNENTILINYNVVTRNNVKAPFMKSKLYSKDKDAEGELFGKRVLVKANGDVQVLSVSSSRKILIGCRCNCMYFALGV